MSAGEVRLIRAGRVPYPDALEWQRELEARRLADEIPDTVLSLEHPPVITLGHRGEASNIVAGETFLAQQGIEVHRTTRGGDVTYHGPGQLVLYPIINLKTLRLTVAQFVGQLEEAMIRTAGDFGVEAHRLEGRPGVFVGANKIGAVGVHISRGVTTHGLAFNVAPDLSHFELIIPCGLRANGVTSLQIERPSSDVHERLSEAEERLVHRFAEVMGLEAVEATPEQARLVTSGSFDR